MITQEAEELCDNAARSEPAAPGPDDEDPWKIAISDFVLLKAPKNAKVPFWIAQVVGKDTFDGVQKIKLRYWKLVDGMRDAYNDEYELEVGANEIWAPTHGATCVQWKIRMAKASNRRKRLVY